eukprot:scaffold163985_cov68-Attheya_sp.AAC.2
MAVATLVESLDAHAMCRGHVGLGEVWCKFYGCLNLWLGLGLVSFSPEYMGNGSRVEDLVGSLTGDDVLVRWGEPVVSLGVLPLFVGDW